ncbi:CopG family transcriptional regulator [Variovorax sp. GT1P44]|uniref:CopG family transcriptional regulator n=1 Tax=Variovorax sp. GT1P44 TaxID=3443742 RepID=UPI003F48A4BC
MQTEHAPPALRTRLPDAEKITINLGYVDLGHIDLMVAEGFYSNRTDFIRTAIRNQLTAHGEALKQVVARKMLVLGLQQFSVADLEAVRRAGEKLEIRVLGLASIAADVTPELALETIGSITVLGALHASPAVKAALADRVH